jgi:hypothetical protein
MSIIISHEQVLLISRCSHYISLTADLSEVFDDFSLADRQLEQQSTPTGNKQTIKKFGFYWFHNVPAKRIITKNSKIYSQLSMGRNSKNRPRKYSNQQPKDGVPEPNQSGGNPQPQNSAHKSKLNQQVKNKFQKRFNPAKTKDEVFTIFSKGYKSKECEFYRKGICKKGNECTFSHAFELKTLDKVCKFFVTGSCYKENCLFSHDLGMYPCKFLHVSGKCDNMTGCKYSHQKFKSLEQMKEFVEDNINAIQKHLANGIITP